MTSSAKTQTMVKTRPPRVCRIWPPSAGMRAAIEVKISTDMPLPIPFSVSSSPSHMIRAVPAVRVMTSTTVVHTESDGMISSRAVREQLAAAGQRDDAGALQDRQARS